MELLLFLADTLALFVLVHTSLRNDQKRPGESLTGPFRYDAELGPANPSEATQQVRNRSGRF